MNREWARFIAVLEEKGVRFSDIQYASDRLRVIAAAGFDDPLAVAVLETEWRRRCADPPSAPASAAEKEKGEDGRSGIFARSPGAPPDLQDRAVAAAALAAALGVGGAFFEFPAGGADGVFLTSAVPPALRGLARAVLPTAAALVELRRLSAAEFVGGSLVGMALGETIGELCAGVARELAGLQRASAGSARPLMAVVAEIARVGQPLARVRQLLPAELLLPPERGGERQPRFGGGGLLGARILNHLTAHAARCAGSRDEDAILQLLLRRALAPYLRILHRWMREGVLEDPYAEFFITEVEETPRAGSGAGWAARDPQGVLRVFAEVSANFDSFMIAAAGGGGEGMYAATASAAHHRSSAQQDVVSFERRFSMNKLLIPSFIEKPSRIPKMVFFAGKYCCLLRESNHARPMFEDSAEEDLLEWSGVDALHSKIQESFEIASMAVIQMLFNSSVDFMGHLSSLKTYFLQERSDWVVDFLGNAEDLLRKSPEKVKIHSLRVLLQSAIARSGAAASDPYHATISCNFADALLEDCLRARAKRKAQPPPDNTGPTTTTTTTTNKADNNSHGAGSAPSVLHCIHLLQLEADLQWPLTLVLDAHVIERFNCIFRLFLWMKTCERMLASLWHTNEALSSFAAAYGIKHQLTQFLRQFLFYAAHFVVEPLWSRMVARVMQTDSVFFITSALNDFFEGVELGLAMSSPQRFSSLSRILDLCCRFCELGVHSSTTTAPLIEATLHAIEDDFLRTLSELAAPIGADYTQLVPLLTWIDFTGFYARNNIYHVLRGASHSV